MDFSNFYSMVLIVAILVLILVLAFMGWTMSKQAELQNFPIFQTTCPDHWDIVVDPATNKPYCKRPAVNYINRGKDGLESSTPGYDAATGFDFSNSGWSAAGDAVCAKKKWADTYEVAWDTITNSNKC